jgi:hypothetical protein
MSRKVGQIVARGERRWLVRVYVAAIAKHANASTTIERPTALCGKHRRFPLEIS